MENEFEQYCLQRLMLLEKENLELKAKIKFFEENSQLNRSNFLYYKATVHEWSIDDKNYAQFEKALTDWDANWLDSHYNRIDSALADYEISIGDKTYYFRVEISSEGAMTFQQLNLDDENFFSSYLAAKEYLIKILNGKIAEIKEKIAKRTNAQTE